ncbi:hypothetical protein Q3G72_010098 [Acer saccharum]|nr:hypothetical protein Q3G72_010098 [Acer saccharum]
MVDATSGVGLMNKSALEANELFEILYENSQQFDYRRDLPKKADAYEETRQSITQLSTSIKNVENQIGQIAILLSQRDQGRLPSQVIPNLKGNMESCKTITLQNGKKLRKEEEKKSEAKEEEEGCGKILISFASYHVIQDSTDALSVELEP